MFRELLLLMVGKCLQILEGTHCKYPLSSAVPCAGPAEGPGVGTVTRVAFAVCSLECLVLKYPSCDLSKELAWACLHPVSGGWSPEPAPAKARGLNSLLTGAGCWLGWVYLPCIGQGQYTIKVLVCVGFLLAVELPKGLFPGLSFRLAISHFFMWGYLFCISLLLLAPRTFPSAKPPAVLMASDHSLAQSFWVVQGVWGHPDALWQCVLT